MWLDRLSGNPSPSASPPQANNRSFSPAPRRSSSLAVPYSSQRPGFNPRVSSQSLVSNESTTSLLGSSRKVNGSGLKQVSRAAEYCEPLDVLEGILGLHLKNENTEGDEIDNYKWGELEFEGLNLRELADQQLDERNGPTTYKPQTTEERMCPVRKIISFAHDP